MHALNRPFPQVHHSLSTYHGPFRNGMFTTSQLSNFSLLLHYLSTTQTLFGDSLPLFSLDGCTGGVSEDALNVVGCVVSVFQFHQGFIDYCIRLRLVNLLYHYLDFYRLVADIFCYFFTFISWTVGGRAVGKLYIFRTSGRGADHTRVEVTRSSDTKHETSLAFFASMGEHWIPVCNYPC